MKASTRTVGRFLTERQVADVIGISIKTLQRWRLMRGYGPRFRKFGSAVRYDRADIEAWIESTQSGGQVIQGPAVMA